MRWIRNVFIVLILVWTVDACLKQPEYSVVPEIELQDLAFKPGDINKQIQDTLIITLKFRDGDGDLGIGAQDSGNLEFYNPLYKAYDTTNISSQGYTNDKTSPLPGAFKFINYYAKKHIKGFDTLPDLNCNNWEQLLTTGAQPKVKDTIYIQQNLRAYNIIVKISTSTDGGHSYTPYDPAAAFTFPGCNVNFFNGSFPDLSSDRGKKSPLDGTLTYKIQSFALKSTFSIKTLKLDVLIKDRAFNPSDTAEMKGFTLGSITK